MPRSHRAVHVLPAYEFARPASWWFPSCGSMALRYILLQCVMDSIVQAGLSQAGT